jgi:hypothetical protein
VAQHRSIPLTVVLRDDGSEGAGVATFGREAVWAAVDDRILFARVTQWPFVSKGHIAVRGGIRLVVECFRLEGVVQCRSRLKSGRGLARTWRLMGLRPTGCLLCK